MIKETAIKKIKKAIDKELRGETQTVKDYVFDIIYSNFQNLETECSNATPTENLKYALAVDLGENKAELLKEARESEAKGRYYVRVTYRFDDESVDKLSFENDYKSAFEAFKSVKLTPEAATRAELIDKEDVIMKRYIVKDCC